MHLSFRRLMSSTSVRSIHNDNMSDFYATGLGNGEVALHRDRVSKVLARMAVWVPQRPKGATEQCMVLTTRTLDRLSLGEKY